MSGFLRALAKIGLVELDEPARLEPSDSGEMTDEEARRIIAEAASPARPPPEPVKSVRPIEADVGDGLNQLEEVSAAEPPGTAIEEGLSLEAIYSVAKVKPSPFSAEKLLRLLEGLKVMDPTSRKMAVQAMDAADEAWTIEDPILDARRKIEALEAHKQRLDRVVRSAEEQAAADLAAHSEYQEKATTEIRNQIAELEMLLQTELEKVASDRANVQAHLEATRQAAAREHARLDLEATRLREIGALFAPNTPETGG